MRCLHRLFILSLFVLGRPLPKNLSGCERLYTRENSLAVFLLIARVSQLGFCCCLCKIVLPFQLLTIGYRGRDPIRHLILYSRAGLTKGLYAVSFTDQVLLTGITGYAARRQLVYCISPVTYLPRTPVTLFMFFYYSFYTIRILKDQRSHTSLHSFLKVV